MEENVEYVEKVDEFDVVVDSRDPEGQKRKAEKEQEEEEAIVSIEAIDTVSCFALDRHGSRVMRYGLLRGGIYFFYGNGKNYDPLVKKCRQMYWKTLRSPR